MQHIASCCSGIDARLFSLLIFFLLNLLVTYLFTSNRACHPGGGEQADVTVSYDSSGSTGDKEAAEGKRSKSGRLRHRSSRWSSVASYHSVDGKPRHSDPSLRCVSVSSTAEGFVHCVSKKRPTL